MENSFETNWSDPVSVKPQPLTDKKIKTRVSIDVVINEINTGNSDWIELYNYGAAKDLTNWMLYCDEYPTQGLTTYTFPSFTLNTGCYVQIWETTGTNDADDLYIGTNIYWNDGGPGAACSLVDNSGVCHDYVEWNGYTGSVPKDAWSGTLTQTGNTDNLYRHTDIDTDTASDWLLGPGTGVTPKAPNPGQTGTASVVVVLTSPNGNENWTVGTQHNIQWTVAGGTAPYSVTLNYSTQGQSGPWTSIPGVFSGTSYTWTVPNIGTASFQCYMRANVTDSTSPTPGTNWDLSNQNFTIWIPPTPKPLSISLSSPSASENWSAGSQHTVSWTITGGTQPYNTALIYSLTGLGGPWLPLASNLPGTSYTWNIPWTIKTSYDCYINATVNDTASPQNTNYTVAGNFTIFNSDSMTPTTTSSLSGTQGNGGWYKSDVTVTLTAYDGIGGSGINCTKYRIDIGIEQNYTSPFLVTGDGQHTVEFYSVDNAQNEEKPHNTVSIKIDKTMPSTAHSLAGTMGSNGWYISPVEVTLSSSDSTSQLNKTCYRMNGGQIQTYTLPFNITDNGSSTVEYYSFDNAGNEELPHKTFTLKIDCLSPTTTATLSGTQGNNSWYKSSVQVSLVANDNSGGSGINYTEYNLDGAGWIKYTVSIQISGEDMHTLKFHSVDFAGNMEADQTLNVNIDFTSPKTDCSPSGTLGTNNWYISSISLILTGSDAKSGVDMTMYRIDSGAWQLYSSPVDISQEGTHKIEYYSVDMAGNIETKNLTTLNIDFTGPTITHVPVTNGTVNSDITILATMKDTVSGVDPNAAKLMYAVGNGTWIELQMSRKGQIYSATIPKADVTLQGIKYYIKAVDNASNQATDPASNLEEGYKITVSQGNNNNNGTNGNNNETKNRTVEWFPWLPVIAGLAAAIFMLLLLFLLLAMKRKRKREEEERKRMMAPHHAALPGPLPALSAPPAALPAAQTPPMGEMVREIGSLPPEQPPPYVEPKPVPFETEEEGELVEIAEEEEGMNIDAELKRLEQMRNKGWITEEEYQESKERLLKQKGGAS